MVEIVKTMGTVFVRIGTAEIHDAEAGTVETVNAAKTARIPISFVLMTTLTYSNFFYYYPRKEPLICNKRVKELRVHNRRRVG